ncbi:uncharacterized protein LOC130670439 [Microplitis mediator]|uniref:uncharacterized protein LOC130670439 n=1 Tax=Microplitis mediator TaxID=375433 RepID=UPI0025531660|nr:uncharacterized protein LOC130670439 [Microplitis mediator]
MIINPQTLTPFSQLKEALIKCFSASESAKPRQLLDGEAIGDRSPSQFLRHLKSLAPTIDEAVLRTRWMSDLPKKTQELLAVSPDTATIDDLAKTADKIHEMFPVSHNAAAAVSTPSNTQISALEKQISELTKCVTALSAQSRQRGLLTSRKPRNRSQSKGRGKLKDGICYYHIKFGKQAYKCADGCKFAGNANGSP